MNKLFAVYLGGRIPWCHIEMHDVQFSIGEVIEDCYEDLGKKWVGYPETTCHIDAFLELKYVDGYEVALSKEPVNNSWLSLFFINAGWYVPEKFWELHEMGFYVSDSKSQATIKALQTLCKWQDKQHQDDLYDVDDCIAIDKVQDYYIQLILTDKTQDFQPMYFGYGLMDKNLTEKIVHYNY